MPTGTRSSIIAKSARKPMIATASVLISFDRLDFFLHGRIEHVVRMKDEAIGPDRDQQHRGNVTKPGNQEERPGRQSEIEGEYVVGTRRHDLVEQGVGLHRDYEQQYQCRKDIDHALITRPYIAPYEIDGDVRAAIGGGGDAPENEDAEHQSAEIVGVGNRIG